MESWEIALVVILIVVNVAVVFFIGKFLYSLLGGLKSSIELLKTGKPATLKVLEVTQTGTWINENPQAALLVEVTLADGSAPPYQTKLTAVIPVLNASAVAVGSKLNAKVDSSDKSKIAIDEPWATALERALDPKIDESARQR
jgi:hypothetical protein